MSKLKNALKKVLNLVTREKQKLVLLSSSYQESINGGIRLVNKTVIIVKPKHITPLLYFWTIKKNLVNYNIVLSSFLTLEYAWLLNFSLLVDMGQSPSS